MAISGVTGGDLAVQANPDAPDLAWPPITNQCRPWAYNWWPGSAVDRENLARQMQRYKDGGLGGIHIIPVYGAKGSEERTIQYLSPHWMEMLTFAIEEGKKIGLGVDMTTGTGWCFGGPTITRDEAGMDVNVMAMDFLPNGDLAEKFPGKKIVEVVASGPNRQHVRVTDRLTAGHLDWRPPSSDWKLYVLAANTMGPQVKRAAPGGEGYMINPLYGKAMRHYLERFTQAFASPEVDRPRSMYHDSYEYGTHWSPDFLAEFEKRRGYSLIDHLDAFAGVGPVDEAARLKGDYRATASELMAENVIPQWVRWCRDRGILTRYQAHGSPANLLDLYADADIPETEMFGHGGPDPLISRFDEDFGKGDRDPLISKFASSAAHTAGHRLVASETGTWMSEHFCETLEEMKCLVDLLFVSGINHVFYHGCCYSPDDATWPGWVFYAATEMNPRNSIWHDVPALNAYIARCQSILQSGEPDNDVLLYWPIHDLWHDSRGLLNQLTVHNRDWLTAQPIGKTARHLWMRGIGFDYVSDHLLQQAHAEVTGITMAEAHYRVVVAPPTIHIPVETLHKLRALAESGATVIFEEKLPADVPGLGDLDARRRELKSLLDGIVLHPSPKPLVQVAVVGRGRILVGDLDVALDMAGVERESIVDHEGTLFIRRRHDHGRYYFIANQGLKPLDGWFALGTPARSVVLMDGLSGRTGIGRLREDTSGHPQVYLQLSPGESVILRTEEDREAVGQLWRYLSAGGHPVEISGPWQVTFQASGPKLPAPFTMPRPGSWTKNGDPEAERFAGTATYRTRFDAPLGHGPWILDLGEVCHSARVRLNGQDLGTLIMHPYRLVVESLKPSDNILDVDVTNLSSNRIRDLDRRGVAWRIFHDINFVNIRYQHFNAADWPLFDSGLLGPVTLR